MATAICTECTKNGMWRMFKQFNTTRAKVCPECIERSRNVRDHRSKEEWLVHEEKM